MHQQDGLLIPFDLLKRIDITNTEKILLCIIGDDLCTNTVKELSDMTGLVPFAVTKALKNLAEDNEIEIIKTKTEKNTQRHNYKRKEINA